MAERPELGGVNAANEQVSSKTTHVLYLTNDALTALETALGKLGATVKAADVA